MDLTLTEKHRALRDEVLVFIEKYRGVAPSPGGGRKRPDAKVLEWQKLLLEHGYFARSIAREYGGFGAPQDLIEQALIADAFSRAGVSPGIHNQGISMLVPTLLEVGTEEQKRRWVGPTIRGDIIWCQGYSEPGSGSDLAAAKTRAAVDDGHFVINGQKLWTSPAHYADMMFLLCRTEPEQSKHAGLSYLLVPMNTPGIEVRPLRTMTGRAEFNETFFTDVRVPVDQIVMSRGQGWHVANITLKYERLLLGDPNKLQQRLEAIRRMMTQPGPDGSRLLDRAEWRDRLLQLQGEVMAGRHHNLRLLTEQAEGVDSGLGRFIVKYHGTMLGHRLASLALDVLGSAGLYYEPQGETGEDDTATTWQIDYMYDIGLIIGGGSSNIQKNIIGERGLGLPREPKATVPAGRN